MSENYQGFTNYATWNIALYADNEYDIYQAKCAWLERLTRRGKTVSAQSARRFYLDYIGIRRTDLSRNKEPGTRIKDVDWADLAETWETDRLEMQAYQD